MWLLVVACGEDAPSAPAPAASTGPAPGSTSEISSISGGSAADVSSGEDPTTTSAADPDSSSGEPPSPPVVLEFVEIAAELGLEHTHGTWVTAPNCAIDQVGPGTGGFCLPQRMTAGVAAADYDGDGWTDLAVTRSHRRPLLYQNRGDGSFTEVSREAGIDLTQSTSGVAWGDFDNDGDPDLYLATLGDTRYYLYINDGRGHFSEEGMARGAALSTPNQHAAMSVAVGDYDLDGYLDLYAAEWRTTAGLGEVPSHSRLLHNLGAAAPGHFEDVTEAAGVSVEDVWQEADFLAGVYSFAPAFGDLDGDGYPELTVVSDFGCSRLFWNDGDGTFTDGTVASGVGLDNNGMGSTFGDYDRDGDLDWYVTSITDPEGTPQNRLYRNDGGRQFTEIAVPEAVGSGGWGWGAAFFDPDNDGDLDLITTNAYYYTDYLEDRNRMWEGEGEAGLGHDIAEYVGLDDVNQGRGLLVFDRDNDGDLDIYIANNAAPPSLYDNLNGSQGGWLKVQAVGTTTNREGRGAVVEVRAEPDGPWQLHEIGASSAHYMGQSEPLAHFGLGGGSRPVAEVRVRWPASGHEQTFTEVERNTVLVVQEPPS